MIKYRFLIFFLFYILLREFISFYVFKLSFKTDSSWMFQFLSTNDLNGSFYKILYLHNQPPIWNIFYWFSFHFFSNNFLLILINKISTYFSVWVIHLLLSTFIKNKKISFLLAILYGMLPELFYYELWDYSSNFTMFIILLNVYLFRKIALNIKNLNFKILLLYSLSFALLSLTRQTYDVLIIFVIYIFFHLFLLKINTKLILIAITISITPGLAWKLKNKIFFDNFTMSSWAPINLYRIASIRLTNDELTNNENDNTSKLIKIGPFKPREEYYTINNIYSINKLQIDTSKVPLCNSGSNSITYLNLSNAFGNKAINLILHYPKGYLLALIQSWALYFNPTSDYSIVNYSSKKFNKYKSIVNKYIYLQPYEDLFGNKNWSKRIFSRSFLSIFIFIYILITSIYIILKSKKSPNNLFVLYITAILLINSLSNFFDSGENMRFRYDVNAIYILSFYFIILKLIKKTRLGFIINNE